MVIGREQKKQKIDYAQTLTFTLYISEFRTQLDYFCIHRRGRNNCRIKSTADNHLAFICLIYIACQFNTGKPEISTRILFFNDCV